ncbi:MAG TPA: PHP domain-containing protein [Gemmatimonadales bacterium]|nr:PHP domain-containing protein [Gemmatimonadales bacterium]
MSSEPSDVRGTVDLHLHSSASDGAFPPAAVIQRAAAAGLKAVALTDHDTLAGVPAAIQAGEEVGLRVVSGCEFSVAAPWGEMHVLGYFLPPGSATLERFLADCRADRERRGRAIVARLHRVGVALGEDDVLAEAEGGAIGRPHVARALVRRGHVATVGEAFDRYLARGRPAFVDKTLPTFAAVAALVHRVGGIVSAAHLKERGTRAILEQFQADGLDAVETRHPSHDPEQRARLTDHALALGLLRSGGSDWHGESIGDESHGAIGSESVPLEWLERLEQARPTPAEPLVG